MSVSLIKRISVQVLCVFVVVMVGGMPQNNNNGGNNDNGGGEEGQDCGVECLKKVIPGDSFMIQINSYLLSLLQVNQRRTIPSMDKAFSVNSIPRILDVLDGVN